MQITTLKYEPNSFKKLNSIEFANNWPVLYILEDGAEMYVGETVNVSSRFKQHVDNPERKKLKRAYIITDDEYNKSATLDIESSLIQYFAADQKYQLQNGNSGMANHNYFDREKYRAKFEVIWAELQKLGLANMDLIQLRNTDVFKYSPYKTLTSEQIEIVNAIERDLQKSVKHTYVINGEPGTGKSVLGVYLIKYLSEHDSTKDLNVALVVPMTALRKTFKKVFSKIRGLRSSMVIGPNEVVGKNYDMLIVDEAHRLRRRMNLTNYKSFDDANKYYNLGGSGTQLDWIMKASSSQVLLYDSKQSVMPGDIRPQQLENVAETHYFLTSQLRVLAGGDYIKYIDNLLSSRLIEQSSFGQYDLLYFDSAFDMVERIKAKNKEHGLARLVAGYAWTWESKKENSVDYDIELDGLKLKWNSKNIEWINSKNAINEVGCIHTVQGYDLNYVGVIIGPELSYDETSGKVVVDKTKYMDFNGKRSIEDSEELEGYIINIYKTLLTRGIVGTYIHAVDEKLAKYLKKFIASQ